MNDKLIEKNAGDSLMQLNFGLSIPEMDPQRLSLYRRTVAKMSDTIPEAVLVGGGALRVWLDAQNRQVPQDLGQDLDYIVSPDNYVRLRKAVSFEGEDLSAVTHSFTESQVETIQRSYERKTSSYFGGKEHSFISNPKSELALKDRDTGYHIDVFARDSSEEVEQLDYQGHTVSIVSPESLFIRRIAQIQSKLHEGNLQERHIIYFLLNKELIRSDKMNDLWIKLGLNGNWSDAIEKLEADIQEAIKANKVLKIVEH